MEGMEYFFELYEKLPRGGPGDNVSTALAYKRMIGLPEEPCILDIGCGPGMQTLELASLSKGKIIAIDNHQPFLDKLLKSAREKGLDKYITAKNMSMLDLDFNKDSFDIIWSEGALYFMGFKNGIARCRELLKDDGYLAVTEAVYLRPDPPAVVRHFWGNEYPDINDIAGNIKLIEDSGHTIIDHFTLPKSSWLDHFYLPMEKELAILLKKYSGNNAALDIYNNIRDEIEVYKQYSDYFSYEFFIMRKIS